MESVKSAKLKYLTQVVRKSLVKVFYTWKTLANVSAFNSPAKAKLTTSPVRKPPRLNVNYLKEQSNKLTLSKTKENFSDIKNLKPSGQKDSIFEEIKSSLVTKARVKGRINSIDWNWKSSLFGSQGLESKGLKTTHKRANTGCAEILATVSSEFV